MVVIVVVVVLVLVLVVVVVVGVVGVVVVVGGGGGLTNGSTCDGKQLRKQIAKVAWMRNQCVVAGCVLFLP